MLEISIDPHGQQSFSMDIGIFRNSKLFFGYKTQILSRENYSEHFSRKVENFDLADSLNITQHCIHGTFESGGFCPQGCNLYRDGI